MLQVCGRKIVRQVVQLAGLPCFWDGQFEPPPSLLKRAKEYVGILANIMELPQSTGAKELLQGEPIALLLKSIGNALAKSDPQASAPAVGVQPATGPQQGQASRKQGKGRHADAALLLDGVAAEKLQGLRAMMVLMNLLGEHLGTHALQVGEHAHGCPSTIPCQHHEIVCMAGSRSCKRVPGCVGEAVAIPAVQ
jgi:hypothetical protein